jgi:hypothetical protein
MRAAWAVALLAACGGRTGVRLGGASDTADADGSMLGPAAEPVVDGGHAGSVEVCDGIDNDGNGAVDEGCCTVGPWESSVADAAGDVGAYAAMAIDLSDGLHAIYYDLGNQDLRYAVRPAGGAWTATTLDSDGDVGRFASIAVEGGRIHVTYRDSTRKELRYATRAPGGAWTFSTVAAGVDEVPETGAYTSIVARAGQVHIAYSGNTTGADPSFLRHAWLGPGGVWSSETVKTMGSYPSMVLDDASDPRWNTLDIAYTFELRDDSGDVTGTGLSHAAELIGGGGGWMNEVILEHRKVVTTSMALGSGGLHVAYYDADANDLGYATPAARGEWETTVIEASPDNVGYHPSLALDHAGGEHVTYYDAVGRNLRYAYRAPRAGTWQLADVDTHGWVGLYSGLVIDSGDVPHVVYYDVSNHALRYATCRR